MRDPLLIRVDVEAMRYQVVHAFNQHMLELSGMLDTGIKKAIEQFDWDGEVAKAAQEALREGVRHSIEDAVRQVMYSTEMKREIKALAHTTVRRYLTGEK